MTRSLYSSIPWPSLPGTDEPTTWTGAGFESGGKRHAVLRARIEDSGWSDELADLMESEVAADRPVGEASRRNALGALRRLCAHGPGKVIMEVGCANGYLTRDLAREFPDTAVIGSDYALPSLEKLADREPTIPLLQLDLTSAHLANEFCDAIVVLNVLEHIEDDQKAIEELYRMLRPGGALVVEVPSSPRLYEEFDRLVGHFRRYRMHDLKAKLERAGFEIDKQSHLGFFAYPAMWALVQLRKRRAAKRAHKDIVNAKLAMGKRSFAQQAMFKVEDAVRPYLPMPFGVRCLVSATKPR